MSATVRWSRTETARRNTVKAHGVHFTPPELAQFLARHALAFLPSGVESTILDPACGDGELLAAVLDVTSEEQQKRLTLIGVDRDASSIAATKERLASRGTAGFHAIEEDFLMTRRRDETRQADLFEPPANLPAFSSPVDLIISNPPYVRTQVLGAEAARKLATEYELTGRVDLYHAFVRGMTDHLRDGGVLGLLCSNRFLTTQGGAALRDLLWHDYELCEIFDLGDTKLFGAAVLPAIVIARKQRGVRAQHCSFTRTYEVRDGSEDAIKPSYSSVLTAIDQSVEGFISVNDLTYEVERGTLQPGYKSSAPWTMTSSSIGSWLETVERHTACTFADLAHIRVGIKTTADSVFIRKDWDRVPDALYPEEDLLRPLLTHHVSDQWRANTENDNRQVLYPHTVIDGRRRAVDLDQYPRAKAYLESHRERLEGRKYVVAGERQWYEIWVPQNPVAWANPKVVFPDISEKPRFFLDTTGAIVNGDCYWITTNEVFDLEQAYLMLAVANSTFAVKFYDAVCSNRLYAGRRRFITQYVKRFPFPQIEQTDRRRVCAMVRELVNASPTSERRAELELQLDELIWRAFGLSKETSGQANL